MLITSAAHKMGIYQCYCDRFRLEIIANLSPELRKYFAEVLLTAAELADSEGVSCHQMCFPCSRHFIEQALEAQEQRLEEERLFAGGTDPQEFYLKLFSELTNIPNLFTIQARFDCADEKDRQWIELA